MNGHDVEIYNGDPPHGGERNEIRMVQLQYI